MSSRKKPVRKSGLSVEEYYKIQKPWQKEIALRLRSLVRKAPSLREEMKYGVPWYVGDEMVCAVMAAGSWVDLGFYRGVDLKDPKKLLEGSGKSMRHVKVHSLDELDEGALSALIVQAAFLKSKKGAVS